MASSIQQPAQVTPLMALHQRKANQQCHSPILECARFGLHEWLNMDNTGYRPSPVSELVSAW